LALLCPGRLDQLIYIPLLNEPSLPPIFKAALTSLLSLSDANFPFLVKNAHGYSGVDLTEICQRTAKLVTRECIDADIWRQRKKRVKEVAAGDEMGEDVEEDGRGQPYILLTRLAWNLIFT
jgi:transitional endoplasmic reticulum ATPase